MEVQMDEKGFLLKDSEEAVRRSLIDLCGATARAKRQASDGTVIVIDDSEGCSDGELPASASKALTSEAKRARTEASASCKEQHPVRDTVPACKHQHLVPDIIELSGGSIDSLLLDLGAFERSAARAISAGFRSVVVHAFLKAGEGSQRFSEAIFRRENTENAKYIAEHPMTEMPSTVLRDFAARAFAMTEGALRPRLDAVKDALSARHGNAFRKLRWHAILTLRRDPFESFAEDNDIDTAIHADSYDGTIAAFALLSTKMPTPIYPQAVFERPPLAMFTEESTSGQRPAEIRLASKDGERLRNGIREWRGGTAVIMPAAVAHSVPPGWVGDFESRSCTSGVLLGSKQDPRWFARVTLELVPARGGRTDGSAWEQHYGWESRELRAEAAALMAEHVWGDAKFA